MREMHCSSGDVLEWIREVMSCAGKERKGDGRASSFIWVPMLGGAMVPRGEGAGAWISVFVLVA